jgi:TRAP-type C4-dicarboxylate transport system substrate-binding protein
MKTRVLQLLAVLAATSAPAPAQADEPIVLRMATPAPDRTAWSREMTAASKDIERRTEGRVKVKWYWGSVAGDEFEIKRRIERGQLDGAGSGGMMCGEVMPTLKAARVTGTFRTRDEATYVVGQLAPVLREEAARSGYVAVGFAGIGQGVIFSRTPIESMEQIRATRLWRWDLDAVAIATETRMGMKHTARSLVDAARAYDKGESDGFYAIPTAALVFQWSVRTPYLTILPGDYLIGCILLAQRAIDRLAPGDRKIVELAYQRMALRFEEQGRRQDQELLGGGFARHGVKTVPLSARFRNEFYEAARRARDQLDDKVVSRAALEHVLKLLADYRAQQGG